MTNPHPRTELNRRGRACRQLVEGASSLLDGNLFWTERLLLRLVRRLYTRRLRELVMILPEEDVEELLR